MPFNAVFRICWRKRVQKLINDHMKMCEDERVSLVHLSTLYQNGLLISIDVCEAWQAGDVIGVWIVDLLLYSSVTEHHNHEMWHEAMKSISASRHTSRFKQWHGRSWEFYFSLIVRASYTYSHCEWVTHGSWVSHLKHVGKGFTLGLLLWGGPGEPPWALDSCHSARIWSFFRTSLWSPLNGLG